MLSVHQASTSKAYRQLTNGVDIKAKKSATKVYIWLKVYYLEIIIDFLNSSDEFFKYIARIMNL